MHPDIERKLHNLILAANKKRSDRALCELNHSVENVTPSEYSFNQLIKELNK